jgi:hypothetical protein
LREAEAASAALKKIKQVDGAHKVRETRIEEKEV